MQIRSLAAALSLALAGCASAPDPDRTGPSFVGVVGTPFVIVFKVPTCAFTIAFAGPVAGLSELARPWPPINAFYGEGDRYTELRSDLDQSLRQNCGPPYAVVP